MTVVNREMGLTQDDSGGEILSFEALADKSGVSVSVVTTPDGAVVNLDSLKDARLIKTLRRPVKILSDGVLTKKLTVQAHRFSKTAQDKITKAGGKAEVLTRQAVK